MSKGGLKAVKKLRQLIALLLCIAAAAAIGFYGNAVAAKYRENIVLAYEQAYDDAYEVYKKVKLTAKQTVDKIIDTVKEKVQKA